MPEEGFLRRWARVKASGGEAVAEAAPPAASVPAAAPIPAPTAAQAGADGAHAAPAPERALTLEDAARLTPASDFSAFVNGAVDKDVRRLALKKLFSDPHFNVPDRLDMYMDDYNKPDPVSAAMLAGLQHARSALRRPEEVQAELARLAARDDAAQAVQAARAAAADDPGLAAVDAATEPHDGAVLPADADADAEADIGAAQTGDDSDPTVEAPADAGIASAIPAPAPAAEEPIAAPIHARPHDKDAIALTIVRAHNTEARP